MQTIKMQPGLMRLIREGMKTATTRLGIKPYTVGPVTFVNAEDPSDTIEGFYIWTVQAIKFIGIDESVSYYEGYSEPQTLCNKLEEIYGEIAPDQIMTVAWFSKNRIESAR